MLIAEALHKLNKTANNFKEAFRHPPPLSEEQQFSRAIQEHVLPLVGFKPTRPWEYYDRSVAAREHFLDRVYEVRQSPKLKDKIGPFMDVAGYYWTKERVQQMVKLARDMFPESFEN